VALPQKGLKKGQKKYKWLRHTFQFSSSFHPFLGLQTAYFKKVFHNCLYSLQPFTVGLIGVFSSFSFSSTKPPSWQRFRAAGDLFFLWCVVVGLVGCVVVCFGGF
jgi:hypothetical protein